MWPKTYILYFYGYKLSNIHGFWKFFQFGKNPNDQSAITKKPKLYLISTYLKVLNFDFFWFKVQYFE
ncbi:MAG: hypothetical protein UZ08_BCD001000942 [Candidatus Parvibacillus calidus]|jgi:hypothetical protein|nr:MAG: hypothetical protein UZ08_BCD001000942 [Candidatus Parvibacillus calidus]